MSKSGRIVREGVVAFLVFNETQLPFNPASDEDGSRYEFKGMASIGHLVVGRAKVLVSPTGFLR